MAFFFGFNFHISSLLIQAGNIGFSIGAYRQRGKAIFINDIRRFDTPDMRMAYPGYAQVTELDTPDMRISIPPICVEISAFPCKAVDVSLFRAYDSLLHFRIAGSATIVVSKMPTELNCPGNRSGQVECVSSMVHWHFFHQRISSAVVAPHYEWCRNRNVREQSFTEPALGLLL
jgi:hypothetical protein